MIRSWAWPAMAGLGAVSVVGRPLAAAVAVAALLFWLAGVAGPVASRRPLAAWAVVAAALAVVLAAAHWQGLPPLP